MDADTLWRTKYAALYAAERAAEDARREQAFLDLPQTVCGEELRAMTPLDLLVLNGVGNYFVGAGPEPTAHDIHVFLWLLNTENDGTGGFWNGRRRLKMAHRVGRLDFVACVREILAHVDGIFQDAPGGSSKNDDTRRPLGTCFLAPLLAGLAADMGPVDPVNGQPLAHCPLPRLFQYAKSRAAAKLGKEYVDFSPSDRLMGDLLSELNEINNRPVAASASESTRN